ncbi:T9SS type A sorting domain-containing protein, partial [Candidatus Poribacteria bacterium]|nr:T9SS type A sorting domain-containing protein [Candidatus Poribacteria bacterium]
TPTPNYTLTGAKDLSTYRLKVQAVDASGNTGPLSNVSDPTKVVLAVQIQLSAGYNLIALPYTPKSPVTAHSLIRDMRFQLVARWDAATQTWDYAMRLPVPPVNPAPPFSDAGMILGNDFAITPVMGIYVHVATDVTRTFDGTPTDLSSGIPLKPGQNLISIPERTTAYTAYALLRNIPSRWVTRWRADTQTWDAVTMLVDQTPIGTDFPIQAGRGYFVQSSSDFVWLPVPIFAVLAPPIPAGTPISAAGAAQVEGLTTGPANLPHPIYGQVYRYDGVTPAHQATVSIALMRQGREVAQTETTVAPSGYWIADASKGQPGDELRIAVKHSDGGEGVYPSLSLLKDPVPQFIGSLILQIRPQVSKLLANYPNPFNPETWIPFQMKQGATVTITIHDVSGQLVRSLDLGFRVPGYYVSKHQAGYWDGTNDSGEKVASGLYFYTIQAGEFRGTRKMLLLK